MQLGTRWAVGAQPPARLPEHLVAAIAAEEATLVAEDVDTAGWHWTLTYLEGRPVVALDDGTVIS